MSQFQPGCPPERLQQLPGALALGRAMPQWGLDVAQTKLQGTLEEQHGELAEEHAVSLLPLLCLAWLQGTPCMQQGDQVQLFMHRLGWRGKLGQPT